MLAYQTATVGDKVQLGYLDSWQHRLSAEFPSSYRTIIAVHPLGFNSRVWVPLLGHLPGDVRVLGFNQRGYSHSAPAFLPQKEGGTDATAASVVDLIDFIVFSINHLGCTGGITLVGAAKGALLALCALAAAREGYQPTSPSFLASLPADFDAPALHTLLSAHLKSVVINETPAFFFGEPIPAEFLAALGPVLPPNEATPQQVGDALAGAALKYAGDNTAHLPSVTLNDLLEVVGEGAWQPENILAGFFAGTGAPGETARLMRDAVVGDALWSVSAFFGANSLEAFQSGKHTLARWSAESGKQVRVELVEGMNHIGMILGAKAFAETLLRLAN